MHWADWLALLREHGILMPRVDVACRFRSPARPGPRTCSRWEQRSRRSRAGASPPTSTRGAAAPGHSCEGEYRVACVDAQTMEARECPPAVRELVARVPVVIERQQREASVPLGERSREGPQWAP